MDSRERRHDIDWLRVLGMLMVFLFHCARFFDESDWHVKNTQLSFGMSVFVAVIAQWMMPLFFTLSAISAYHALSHRDDGQYIRERFKRLVVPLIFGTLVLAPPQVYVERISHAQFRGSFIDFLPHYFDGLYGFGGNFAWMGLHLWYLEMLFIFSLLTLPLFRHLWPSPPRAGGHTPTSPLRAGGHTPTSPPRAGGTEGGRSVFLLAFPLALVEMAVNLQPNGVGRRDLGRWSPLTYLVFFILGYLVARDERLKISIERNRGAALVTGIISTGAGFLLLQAGHSPYATPFAWLRALNAWSWLVAILGLGSRHLSFRSDLLVHANRAVLPFYVLHQTIIVVIGYYAADWSAGVLVKFVVVAGLSFVAIVAVYELAIKRSHVLQFLFGMKRSPSAQSRRSDERDLAQNLARCGE